ncbi:hypothetical protein H1Q63_31220 [Desmonostoc muscorum CCALA 125]|nr:hypothetical protein [Desmonostoc muscorum CCALA 125]
MKEYEAIAPDPNGTKKSCKLCGIKITDVLSAIQSALLSPITANWSK